MHPVNPQLQAFTETTFTSRRDLEQWNQVDIVMLPGTKAGKYVTGVAASDRAKEAALRLRYEVFNVELGEGLEESSLTGLDSDRFDEQMSHLILVDTEQGIVVGTYRVQTVNHGLRNDGLYSAQEYVLDPLEPYFPKLLELGRACLAQGHRTFTAIFSVWLGIGAFMNVFDQRYLFGCSSLTSQDPDDGWRALKTIREEGYLHSGLFLTATPEYVCGAPGREYAPDLGDPIHLPKLFRTYMRLGAQVISEPALDRQFGTVDFLILLDGHEVALSGLDVLK